jgi:hypothetical protein
MRLTRDAPLVIAAVSVLVATTGGCGARLATGDVPAADGGEAGNETAGSSGGSGGSFSLRSA